MLIHSERHRARQYFNLNLTFFKLDKDANIFFFSWESNRNVTVFICSTLPNQRNKVFLILLSFPYIHIYVFRHLFSSSEWLCTPSTFSYSCSYLCPITSRPSIAIILSSSKYIGGCCLIVRLIVLVWTDKKASPSPCKGVEQKGIMLKTIKLNTK